MLSVKMESAITAPDGWDKTVRAIDNGDVASVRELLSGDVDANTTNENGSTFLMRAAANGRPSIVELLLDHGANINAQRVDGFTPLLFAVFFGHLEVVRLLLERGADAGAQTRFATSAGMWANVRGFDEIQTLLRSHQEKHLSPASLGAGQSTNAPAEQTVFDPEITLEMKPISSSAVEERTAHHIAIADWEQSPAETSSLKDWYGERYARNRIERTCSLAMHTLDRLTGTRKRLAAFTGIVMLLAGAMTVAFLKWDAQEAKEESSARSAVNSRDLTRRPLPARVPANADKKIVNAESRSPGDSKAIATTTRAFHVSLPRNNTFVARESPEQSDRSGKKQKRVDSANRSTNGAAPRQPSASPNQQGEQLSSSGPHKNAAAAEERNASLPDGSRSLGRTPSTERSVSGTKSDNKKVIRWP